MNFKMKTLVAALALTASAGASAANGIGFSATTGAGPELYLTAHAGASTYTFDLLTGLDTLTMASFTALSGTNFSVDLTAANYATAWNAMKTDLTAVGSAGGVYQVRAMDTGTKNIMSTSGSGLAAVQGQTLPAFSNFTAGNNGSFIAATNVKIGAVADGSSIIADGTTNATEKLGVYTTKIGGNWAGAALGWTADAAVGTALSFYQLTNTPSATGNASVTEFGTWNIDVVGNKLTYTAAAPIAAVPEADTWAMLLAGLGLMGFIARRRTAA